MNEDIDLARLLRGRAAFLISRGEVKTPDLLLLAADALDSKCRRIGPTGEKCSLTPPCPDCGLALHDMRSPD